MIQKAIDTDMMSGNKIRMLIFLFFIDTSSKFSIFYWRNTTVLFKDIAEVVGVLITALTGNEIGLFLCAPQSLGSRLHPHNSNVGGKAHTGFPLKEGGEVGGTQMQMGTKPLHR